MTLSKEQINNEETLQAFSYAFGAAMAINIQRSNEETFQNHLNKLINNAKTIGKYNHLSFDELAELTAELTLEKIKNNNDDVNDLDTVAWEMGVFCYTWRNSLAVCNNEFDQIFIASWEKYFKTLANKKRDLDIVFKSSDHIRYENEKHIAGPHGGAPRVIVIEPVANESYYHVTIYNTRKDAFFPEDQMQMVTKQMKIVKTSENKIDLRGFGTDSFGYPFDKYGITIQYKNNEIEKVTLHIFHRGIDIEYLK